MPTGYTDRIKDGISFRQFALQCARAFGALITMREDPLDANIPDKFEPDPYRVLRLEQAREALDKWLAMPDDEKLVMFTEHVVNERNNAQMCIDAAKELKEKYLAMRAKVLEWTPPTDEHVQLKSFMLGQLNRSIEYDCGCSYYEDRLNALADLDFDKWCERYTDMRERDVTYNETELEDARTRAEGRTEWVRQLRESLPDDE